MPLHLLLGCKLLQFSGESVWKYAVVIDVYSDSWLIFNIVTDYII
jgi:hypothetical protein